MIRLHSRSVEDLFGAEFKLIEGINQKSNKLVLAAQEVTKYMQSRKKGVQTLKDKADKILISVLEEVIKIKENYDYIFKELGISAKTSFDEELIKFEQNIRYLAFWVKGYPHVEDINKAFQKAERMVLDIVHKIEAVLGELYHELHTFEDKAKRVA